MRMIIVDNKETAAYGKVTEKTLDFLLENEKLHYKFHKILEGSSNLEKNVKRANKFLKKLDLDPIQLMEDGDEKIYHNRKKYSAIAPGGWLLAKSALPFQTLVDKGMVDIQECDDC